MRRIFFLIFLILVSKAKTTEDYYLINQLNNRGFSEEKVLIYHDFLLEYQKLIADKLRYFKRPFSYLDLGSIQPKMNEYIKNRFDAYIISLKNENVGNSRFFNHDFCSVFMNTNFSISNIYRFSECEFFDVVTIFNPFAIFGKDWEIQLKNILNLGFLIFVEIPPIYKNCSSIDEGEIEKLEKFLKKNGGKDLSSPLMKRLKVKLYFFEKNEKKYHRGNFVKRPNPFIEYQIKMDYTSGLFSKKYQEVDRCVETNFIPGINLLTFLMLKGTMPSREMLKQELEKIVQQPHRDFMPHNMILSAEGLQLIDFDDFRQQESKLQESTGFCEKGIYENLIKIIDSKNIEYIESMVINSLK